MNDVLRSGPSLFLRGIAATLGASALLLFAPSAFAQTVSNSAFALTIGTYGEINSLQITGDAFPTNYVLNGTNGPTGFAASTDHEWVGELMFQYRLGTGAWTQALTNQSADVRTITQSGNTITVTYQNSANAKGVQNFKVVETYTLESGDIAWQIAVTNTSTQTLELGDFGLPLPFNEYWGGGDIIYETRTVYHSFVGQNTSYVTIKRPSGAGPFLLLAPDPTTGAGFEYKDNWTIEEHPNSVWAEGGSNPWPTGLEVYYIHSNVIKSTNQGYLPNTSLMLAPNESQTYGFKFFAVADQDAVKTTLYSQGLVDVTAVPGMMFATNMTGMFDLHTSKPIQSVTAQYPSQTTITPVGAPAGGTAGHNLYTVTFLQLGPNNVVVTYGSGETTTLQFYAIEPIDAAIQRHATFMVGSTQWSSGDLDGILDDWMMDTRAKRGATGGWGWGDDWGWTKAEFLAEKNAQTPVAAEVTALDTYLDAVWARAIDNTQYIVQDWWCPAGTNATTTNNCYYDRAYAYPHAFNTFFSMYKVASLYPSLVTYHQTADTYLLRAYDILHTLYNGHGSTGTGYMGEQTLPEIQAALTAGGHTTEAAAVGTVLTKLYQAFKGNPYPYGSEYTYDNTGEEAVYTAAKVAGDSAILSKVNAKTRACRGQEPVWYWYADPVTINGEAWWQFQYTASLAGYCMDDWIRNGSTTPEEDERLSYAAKIANISAINSGQIDSNATNLGTVAWTYQAMKGNEYRGNAETGKLHNAWRQMAGEADLGLFGAIRTLSADVAVDPIFGLYGYGCNVVEENSCYAITPLDGVFKRLNLVSQKLSLTLNRDRYTGATISTASNFVGLTLENQTPAAAHTTTLTITGLAAGTYTVAVGGASQGMVTAQSGQPAVVSLMIGAAATYSVQIGSGCVGVSPDAGVTLADGGGTTGATGSSGAAGVSGLDAGAAAVDATTGGSGATSGGSGATSGSGAASGTATGGTPSGGSAGTHAQGDTTSANRASNGGCACTAAGASAPPTGALGVIATIAAALAATRRRRRA
jgi:MYXO-CTERM domain-containing protein